MYAEIQSSSWNMGLIKVWESLQQILIGCVEILKLPN